MHNVKYFIRDQTMQFILFTFYFVVLYLKSVCHMCALFFFRKYCKVIALGKVVIEQQFNSTVQQIKIHCIISQKLYYNSL